MPKYAHATKVTSYETESAIKKMLQKHGAKKMLFFSEDGSATVMFDIEKRRIKVDLLLPSREHFLLSPTGNRRNDVAVDKALSKAINQRWRVLALVIKAKLEAIESEVTSLENEFLAQIVLPGGRTFGEAAAKELQTALVANLPQALKQPR